MKMMQHVPMKKTVQENPGSQIVILSMEIDLPDAHNLLHENDYQLMLEKTRVTEQVYHFAELIQAAVVEVGSHNYILFSTRQLLEEATESLRVIPILQSVMSNTAHTLSIGIGYGRTAREAKHHAALGLNRALTKGGNQAVIVKEGLMSEPILGSPQGKVEKAITDPIHMVISEGTGLSINTIYKLHCIREQMKTDTFITKNLAEAFGNTPRSMNRIVEKLLHAGYAEIKGTRMMGDTGRPSRVVQLKF